MKRAEIVRQILALSPQTGLPGGDVHAYADADMPALTDLLKRLEGVSASGRELREQQKVSLVELEARVAEVRARRDGAVERLSGRLDALSAKLSGAAGARDAARAAVAATVPTRKNSLDELLRRREELERQIEALRSQERENVVARIRQLVAEYDLTPADLKLGRRSVGAVKVIVDPKTGKTWSGRGRRPKWLTGVKLPAEKLQR